MQLLPPGVADEEYVQTLEAWWRHGRPRVSCPHTHYLVEEAARPLLDAVDRPWAYRCRHPGPSPELPPNYA